MMSLLRLGTRGSPLALAQTEETKRRLMKARPELSGEGAIEVVVIQTTGDRIQNRPLAEVGGKGLFTKEIEEALYDRRIDVAVHSMKDMPTWPPDFLTLGAYLPREDPRDAFFSPIADRIAALPAGAVIGTSSLRRQSQILALRLDLRIVSLRGNVDTRLRKLAEAEVDATLLALAGLRRLGRADRPHSVLEINEMLPAVGQGAIGLQCRREDERTLGFLAAIDHQPTRARVTAERACLAVLDGSCRTPIAALAEVEEGDRLYLRGLVAAPDGSSIWRAERRSQLETPEELGRAVGQELRVAAGEEFFAALAKS